MCPMEVFEKKYSKTNVQAKYNIHSKYKRKSGREEC